MVEPEVRPEVRVGSYWPIFFWPCSGRFLNHLLLRISIAQRRISIRGSRFEERRLDGSGSANARAGFECGDGFAQGLPHALRALAVPTLGVRTGVGVGFAVDDLKVVLACLVDR